MKRFRPIALLGTACVAALMPGSLSAAEILVDARQYSGPAWSPYLVGALLGVLSWLTFYFSDKSIGASSFYATLAGMIGKLVAKKHTESLADYKTNTPAGNWEFAFVIVNTSLVEGVAPLAALSGGENSGQWLPPMWEARFGEGTVGLRAAVAIFGGILMAFGARLAGGCTSGHGISGTLQLSVGSWIAVGCFFIGGIAVAMLLFVQ